jgi:hypothetical protein
MIHESGVVQLVTQAKKSMTGMSARDGLTRDVRSRDSVSPGVCMQGATVLSCLCETSISDMLDFA